MLNYYQKNKEKILLRQSDRKSNLSDSQKEKIKSYNREYYNRVRKLKVLSDNVRLSKNPLKKSFIIKILFDKFYILF